MEDLSAKNYFETLGDGVRRGRTDNDSLHETAEDEPGITAEFTAKKEDVGETAETGGHLTIDVFQSGDDIIIQSTIAGTNPDDIDISVTKDMVTIKGKREPEEKINESDYFHQELYWGPFSRAIILPVDVDADNAKASFKNGVLTIKLPRLDRAKK